MAEVGNNVRGMAEHFKDNLVNLKLVKILIVLNIGTKDQQGPNLYHDSYLDS